MLAERVFIMQLKFAFALLPFFLAEGFFPNPTYDQWRIKTREGVTFHNGEPFNAQAILDNIEFHRASPLTGSIFERVVEVEVIDEINLRIALDQPVVQFPAVLTTQVGVVMAPSMVADPDRGRNPSLTPPPLSLSFRQAKSVSKVIKADIYPEFGTYPGGGESPIIPFGSEKNAEREVIHGRWAMLGVTGAWAAENGTGIPWFTAGTLCTPDDCTAVADKFPGAVAPLAPEGSGYPSFWAVLAIEVVLVGLAEAYRTGLSDPVFDELTVGDVSPGGRFDPLGLAESGDLEELKIKELKHCRLSMFAWLGCIFQGLATQEGPIANWQAHVADPVHANVLTNAASGFGFY